MLAKTIHEVLLVNLPYLEGYELQDPMLGSVGIVNDNSKINDDRLYYEAKKYAFEMGYDTCVNCHVTTTPIVTGYGQMGYGHGGVYEGQSSTNTKLKYDMYFTMCNRIKK